MSTNPWLVRIVRWLVAAVLLGAWLVLLTSRQTALYPTFAPPGPELLPVPITVAVLVASVALRAARPTIVTHVVFLAVTSGVVALLAAHLGSPLANASGNYCGDFCRSAIMGRFLAFFGWPLLTSGGLLVLAHREARLPAGREAMERAAWSRAWAGVTLVVGLCAAVAWWRIILPNG